MDAACDEAEKQTVLFLEEEAGDTERGKCKDVIKQRLRNRKHVAAAGLEELQNAVGKCSRQTGCRSVQVADEADEEHAEERDGTAPRKLKEPEEGRYKRKRQRNRGDRDTNGAKIGVLVLAGHGQNGDDDKKSNEGDQNDVTAFGKRIVAVFMCDELKQHGKHKKNLLVKYSTGGLWAGASNAHRFVPLPYADIIRIK